MKALLTFDPPKHGGTLCSSGFYDQLTDPEDWKKPHRIYGAVISAEKADAIGKWCDQLKYSSQKNALEAVLCGNYTTGTHTEEVEGLVTELCKQLQGSYRGAMATKTAPYVFAALKTIWGEALKEARGGTPANFSQALRNLADVVEAGGDLRNTPCATGTIPKDH